VAGSREQLLSAVGKALASVGHELNNIVGVVQSYAAFIQEGGSEQAAADAQVIRGSSEKAALLARQLLAFGHPREQAAEALELGPFLIDVQGFLQRALGEARSIALELGAEPAVVLVGRAALGRLLLELVLAVHGEVIESSLLLLGVKLQEAEGARVIELSLREQRSSGAGAVASAPRLDWEAMRRMLAEHDATLATRMDTEGAFSVSLCFPALDALHAPEHRLELPRLAARGTETVLIVEADGELRLAICRMLEAAGYRALEAEDSGVARSLGLEGDVPVDLLLWSGDDAGLADELRDRHPNLTTLRQHKPFSSLELQAAVRSALDDRARSSQKVPRDAARVLALVVDDDPHVRLALSRILSDVGSDVVTAPSGLHALQKLQALPIDLLIADQSMPGMEGTRLLETAYRTWPRVVRVVYTGYLSSGLVVDAVNRANVHKLLAKDMPPEWLYQQLGEVVAAIRAARPT
jgi:CheY-like chemotaxis protein